MGNDEVWLPFTKDKGIIIQDIQTARILKEGMNRRSKARGVARLQDPFIARVNGCSIRYLVQFKKRAIYLFIFQLDCFLLYLADCLESIFLSNKDEQIDYSARVSPLVIIPRYQFHKVGVE